jgi:hypothetical protein
MNALQVVWTNPRTISKAEAAFHPSAEQYRERANVIRDSIGGGTGTQERGRLLDMAMEFEQLAAALEEMRCAPAQASGLIALARRSGRSSAFR